MNGHKVKYRGKDVSTGEWRYGSLVMMGKTPFIYEYGEDGSLTQHEVDPETVGESIYLTDMADKDVYVGDVIKGFDVKSGNNIWYVDFYAFNLSYRLINENKLEFLSLSFLTFLAGDLRVIGNIYDNKELRELVVDVKNKEE